MYEKKEGLGSNQRFPKYVQYIVRMVCIYDNLGSIYKEIGRGDVLELGSDQIIHAWRS